MESRVYLFDSDDEEFLPETPMPEIEDDYSGFSQVLDQNNDPLVFWTDSQSPKHSSQERQLNSTELNPSNLDQAYLGAHLPKNTKSASRSAFKIFGKFVLNELKNNPNNAKCRTLVVASEHGNVIYPGEN